MFDLSLSEMLVVFVVAVLVVGPKDLPRAMATVGKWIGRARATVNQFKIGLDDMVREAEMKEMEEKWAKNNARIMAEHPPEEMSDEEVTTETSPPVGPPPPELAEEGGEMTPLASPPEKLPLERAIEQAKTTGAADGRQGTPDPSAGKDAS